jgi:L-amino acid N-acyltransferase YncA
MKIRIAGHKDLSAINEIYNQAIKINATAHLEPRSIQQTEEWFNEHNKQFPVYVAEKDGNVTAWLSFSSYRPGREALSRVVEISYYVHENYRRKRIGEALIGFALDLAPSLNFSIIIAILLDNNKPSIKLLEKFGFERWGLIPDAAEFDNLTCGHLFMGRKI